MSTQARLSPTITNVVTRDDFDNDDILYSDQHISASSFPSPNFDNNFGDPVFSLR
jgi:hypothetical protein